MKKFILLLMLWAGAVLAVPSANLQLTSPVIDPGGRLTAAERQHLSAQLRGWWRANLFQGAVVIVDDFNGRNGHSYALEVFSRWRLGHRERNDGLLLVIDGANHYFMLTGRGLDKRLPSSWLRPMLREKLKAQLPTNPAAAIEASFSAVAERLGEEEEAMPLPLVIALLLFALVLSLGLGKWPAGLLGAGAVALFSSRADGGRSLPLHLAIFGLPWLVYSLLPFGGRRANSSDPGPYLPDAGVNAFDRGAGDRDSFGDGGGYDGGGGDSDGGGAGD